MALTEEGFDSSTAERGRYDELLDRRGVMRPHWVPFIEHVFGDGPESARRGVELARRLIIENGVTYNVYADPQGKDRPWVLDPVPLLITGAEWRDIEAGVAQRARLMNALLGDLYGPQKLIADGTIPAELAFGHPNFLWPCRGISPPGGRFLQIYACDLARAPDGRWWLLGDRVQTPSGTGYALENRQIVARVYPDLIDGMGVRSIGGFFAGLREVLLSGIEAQGSESTLAVVLTPGPLNETYFEHAYLARHLGLPLVEGNDLTVRGETVYLKTLSGLRRVHAILRRLDDDFCDPLELRADSALGVPGLLGAARAGRVNICNSLGSGVLESAAWLGFMPAAARALLGENLRLPSVATWWCGEEPALDEVLRNLDRLVLKPTFPNQRFEPAFARDLDEEPREQLVARLRARPYAYVAQERLSFSQAPVWRGGSSVAFAARPMGIRVYAMATPEGYVVMPGGMARIAAETSVGIVSTQRGGGSKDIWVLPEDGDKDGTGDTAQFALQFSGMRATHSGGSSGVIPRLPVRHDEVPSGLVENLFWLGRYAERCEDKTRLLRAAFVARADAYAWRSALETCRQFGVLDDDAELTAASIFDGELPLGLSADLGRLGWCAARARSRLSAEHWRSLNALQRQLHEAEALRAEPRETLDRLLLALASLAGFFLDDMTQDDGWRLMMLGRRLERIQFMAELLGTQISDGQQPRRGELEWLLEVGGSTITYRTRYMASPRLSPVIQLLVFDEGNPRSLAFHWAKVQRTLVQLAASLGGAVDDTLEAPIRRVASAGLTALEGSEEEASAARLEMAAALQGLDAAAGRLCDRISLRHFSHVDMDLRAVAT